MLKFPVLSSTQQYVKEHYPSFPEDQLTCVIAEKQTKGRGRGKNHWLSFPGSLCMSLFSGFSSEYPPQQLSLVFALTVCKALEPLGISLQIKWPNDLMLRGEKCGGILGEALLSSSRHAIILGLGLNVAVSAENLKQIDQQATSLNQYTAKCPEIAVLPELICNEFTEKIALWEKKGFSPFQKEYNSRLIVTEKQKTSFNASQEHFLEIDVYGRFVVLDGNGTKKALWNLE